MGMGVFLQKDRKMPGAHKIGAAISGPRIAGGNFMDTTLFLSNIRGENAQPKSTEVATKITRSRELLEKFARAFPCFPVIYGRRIFIHHQCWEVLPFCRFQRQRCIKILCPKDPHFYTPLALKTAKGQHLPALVVYKNPSPNISQKPSRNGSENLVQMNFCFFIWVDFGGDWISLL